MKEFWKILCDVIGYRLFVGKVFNELSFVYNSMSPDFLHFIPTIDNFIATNISNGVVFSGNRVCLISDSKFLSSYDGDILPMLIITDNKNKIEGLKCFNYINNNSLFDAERYIIDENKKTAIVFNDNF